MKAMAAAPEKYTWDNKFALFRTLLDEIIDKSYEEMRGRWIKKLAQSMSGDAATAERH